MGLNDPIPNAAYPTAGQGLTLDLTGKVPVSALPVTTYRKTTAKTVNTTTTATDLLNNEITVAAGVMGTTGVLRLTARGDWVQNSGGAAVGPRLQLILGGTTIFDTGAGASVATSATREPWRLIVEIGNLGSASSQSANMNLDIGSAGGFTAAATNFTTGEGLYSTVYNGTVSVLANAFGFNTSAVNTGLSATLVLNVINGSANASYETKLSAALVEVV